MKILDKSHHRLLLQRRWSMGCSFGMCCNTVFGNCEVHRRNQLCFLRYFSRCFSFQTRFSAALFSPLEVNFVNPSLVPRQTCGEENLSRSTYAIVGFLFPLPAGGAASDSSPSTGTIWAAEIVNRNLAKGIYRCNNTSTDLVKCCHMKRSSPFFREC